MTPRNERGQFAEVLGFLILFTIIVALSACVLGVAAAAVWTIWMFPWLLVLPVLFAFCIASLAIASNSW